MRLSDEVLAIAIYRQVQSVILGTENALCLFLSPLTAPPKIKELLMFPEDLIFSTVYL